MPILPPPSARRVRHHRFLHPRFSVPIAATVTVIALMCATDTAESPESAMAVMTSVPSDIPAQAVDVAALASDQDLVVTKREYAQALRARIDALANTAFAVNADDTTSDDYEAWLDLEARQERLESELASIAVVSPDEWSLLRENIDAELGGRTRALRTAARMQTVVPR